MDDIFVGRLMSAPVTTVSADAAASDVADRMLEEGISSVVVTDDDGQMVGILTSTDFVRIAAEGETTSVSVAEHMTTDVVTTTANDTLESVADLLIEHGIHHAPVVDDTEGVVGMITTTDLTAYLSGIAEPSPARVAN